MPDAPPFVRAFIAVNLPAPVRERLADWQRALKAQGGGAAVRWTPLEQIHLTLRFLGNVPTEAVPEIAAALQRAGAGTVPFELRAEGLGCFPNVRRPRLIWVGLAGDLVALRALQQAVARETAPWGEREDREFLPHLTIGRIKDGQTAAARLLAEALPGLAHQPPTAWRVTQVDLMQSVLRPAGAAHSSLATVPLATRSV
jgi:2'-5' RNA ligase